MPMEAPEFYFSEERKMKKKILILPHFDSKKMMLANWKQAIGKG
jgi:hypothetical protein